MKPPTTNTALARRARFAAVVVVVLSAALFVTALLTARQNRLPNGTGLGADFLAFYDAGRILIEHGADRLYDLPLQSAEYHAQLPGEPPDAFLPFAYAPHVAAPFALLARLPYASAYVVWTAISVAAYALAVVVAVRAADVPRAWWPTIAWLAASFEPFAFECVHGGQLSTVAVALLAIAAALSVGGRHFLSGLVLGCCCYKPTLLVILVPGLVVTRRWRSLVGCASAVAAWAIVDLLAFGVGPCRAYVSLVTGYAGRGAFDFRLWKFVDVHSFTLLLGGSQNAATVAAALLALAAIASLRQLDDRIFWAAALAWTPVANLYAGVYDTVLIVPAMILLQQRRAASNRPLSAPLKSGDIRLIVALWVAPWITSIGATAFGIQVFTLVLAAFPIWVLARDASDQPPVFTAAIA